jgi:hypothetical protein
VEQVNTSILIKHKELIITFFQANNFKDVRVLTYNDINKYGTQEIIRLFYNTEEGVDITFMALRHSGVQNMLDDFLMKCGVDVYDLHATELLDMKEAMEIAIKI